MKKVQTKLEELNSTLGENIIIGVQGQGNKKDDFMIWTKSGWYKREKPQMSHRVFGPLPFYNE